MEVQGKAKDAATTMEELREDMLGALNAVVDGLSKCSDSAEAHNAAMHMEVDELKVELACCYVSRDEGVQSGACSSELDTCRWDMHRAVWSLAWHY